MKTEPLPPNSPEAEQAILGALLLDPARIADVEHLPLETFFDLRHRILFDAILDMRQTGLPIAADTLAIHLKQADQLEEAGGMVAIAHLTEITGGAANLDYYVQQVAKAHQQRLAIRTLTEARQALESDPAQAVSILRHAGEALGSLAPEAACAYAARPLSDIPAHRPDDGTELLRHRFLCRHGTMLFAARTGLGKSSAEMQMAVCWSLGKPCFDIRPAAPLRSLIIQSENDAGDLAEMRDGIFHGLNLTPSEQAQAASRIHVAQVDDVIGPDFIAKALRPLVETHKPDLVWLDPLMAYLGGDVSDQETVSNFLRAGLLPVIHRANAGLVTVHHTVKPQKDNNGRQQARAVTDLAYAGAGSAELANFHRAILAMEPTARPGVFTLHLGKRGRRVGWTEPDGQTPAYSRTIAHGLDGRIYWRELTGEEALAASIPDGKGKDDLLKHVPGASEISKSTLLGKAQSEGIGDTRARRLINGLLEEQRLFVRKVKRPGTNPITMLSRYNHEEAK